MATRKSAKAKSKPAKSSAAIPAAVPSVVNSDVARIRGPTLVVADEFNILTRADTNTARQIQSHMLAHQYEGLIEKSNLRGKKRTAPKAPARR